MTGAGPCRLVVAAHKGGVGKTTLAVSLAGAFAEAGKRTLLVDVDPQGAASAALGVQVTGPTLRDVLLGDADPSDAIGSGGGQVEGLDVLPAAVDLAAAEIELPPLPSWQTRLGTVLAHVDYAYDVVIFDSAPGLGVLPFAALVAGEGVVIAATPAFLSLRALGHVVEMAKQARAFNAAVRVIGIVPSIVDGRRTLHKTEVLAEIEERWPGWTLSMLPKRVALEDAALNGEPITVYAPRSAAAEAARTIAREVLDRAAA